LEASGEEPATRQRLAVWCLTLAERSERDLVERKHQGLWVARLDADVANLRAAIGWFLEVDDGASILRLISASADYWQVRLYDYAEGRRWLNAGLSSPAALPRDRAVAHHILAHMESMLGNLDSAADHAQRGLERARETGDPALLGAAHYDVGMVWELRGDGDRAAAAYAEALGFMRQAGKAEWAAWVLGDLADKLVWRGELDKAIPMLDEAVADLRRFGDKVALAWVLGEHGHGVLAQGHLPVAARSFAESLAVAEDIRYERVGLGAITGLAGVALADGQAERAARLLGATEAAREVVGVGRVAHTLHADRIVDQTRSALETFTFDQAWSAGRLLTREELIAEALAFADAVAKRTVDPPSPPREPV
jgi:non-specific serine/threonine protein kinase